MLHLETRGPVELLVMQHGKANAMDTEFCDHLDATLKRLREAPARPIVLTGQGRIFSAGVDLLRVLDGGAEYVESFIPSLGRVLETLFSYPAPVVAAINGHAIAGGCILAAAADHRLMGASDGRIGVPELLVGVPFPVSALEIMRFATAPQHLQTVIYGGGTFPTDAALVLGLIDATATPETLLDEALAAAAGLASRPAEAFAVTKLQLRSATLQRIRDGARYNDAVREIWGRPESLAAIRAYVERTFRRPGA